MTYKVGELQRTVPPSSPECDETGPCVECMLNDGDPQATGPVHVVQDARGPAPLAQAAFLPHSCDAWVIGGPAEVRALRDDLNLMLEMWEEAK